MTHDDFAGLGPGDFVRNTDTGRTYVVIGNYGVYVTIADALTMHSPANWELISKVMDRQAQTPSHG